MKVIITLCLIVFSFGVHAEEYTVRNTVIPSKQKSLNNVSLSCQEMKDTIDAVIFLKSTLIKQIKSSQAPNIIDSLLGESFASYVNQDVAQKMSALNLIDIHEKLKHEMMANGCTVVEAEDKGRPVCCSAYNDSCCPPK
jgi:hypothetical protein